MSMLWWFKVMPTEQVAQIAQHTRRAAHAFLRRMQLNGLVFEYKKGTKLRQRTLWALTDEGARQLCEKRKGKQ